MKLLTTSVVVVCTLFRPSAADAGATNHVEIKNQLYFSVMDDSSDYGVSGEGLLNGQVFHAEDLLTYIIESRSPNPISLIVSKEYEPFVCRLFDSGSNAVPLTAFGVAHEKAPPPNPVKANYGSFYQ